MKHGDFSGLGAGYARFRPGYSETVLSAILALAAKPAGRLDAVDVGAGTGIWTRMLAARCRRVIAVEPNDDMRGWGQRTTSSKRVQWRAGSAERTGLGSASADLVSMASSFHWTDFPRSTREFARVLRPGGLFVALWNPRLVEANPLLAETEAYLKVLQPRLKRVSSGRSGLTEHLTEMLCAHPRFEDVVYIEGRHTRSQSVAQYIGTWRSVNDVRVQLGPVKFEKFLAYVERRLTKVSKVETTYLTRAWVARRK